MTLPAHMVHVAIEKPPAIVYEYAHNPQNLPKWAEGLSRATLVKQGEDWIAESPMGKVKVRFAADNKLGVMDHDVTLPTGEVNHNPFRVVANGKGSEVIFTLFRQPRMTDIDFKKDAAQIEKDLKKLKSILEGK